MNDRDFMRYSRQILLEDIAIDGQKKLLESRVLIVGLGGLGTPAALYLAGEDLLREVALADVVLDCTDNMATRQAINAACVTHNTPLITASAVGLGGQIMVLTPPWAQGCYRCLWPDDAEPERNCRTAGILGPVVGVMGTLQALETIKLLSDMETDRNTLRLFEARSGGWRHLALHRASQCPVCGGQNAHSV